MARLLQILSHRRHERNRIHFWFLLPHIVLAAMASRAGAAVEPAGQIDPEIENLLAVKTVGSPALSPDGSRVAYEVVTMNRDTDSTNHDIWMVEVASGESTRLTYTAESEHTPRWHPDGRSIGFLSDRHDPEGAVAQVWLLPAGAGEARRVTDFEDGVEDFIFSPDGTQLAVILPGPDPFKAPGEEAEIDTAPPIVIDRFAFKADGEGYLTRERHLRLVAIDSGESRLLAAAVANPARPAFSPDGRMLAFVARAAEDPDRSDNFDVFTVAVDERAPPRAVVQTSSALCLDHRPQWSPDSRYIACTTAEADRDGYYAQNDIVLIDTREKTIRNLTATFDRNVYQPRFSADGSSLLVVVEDDMMQRLARITIETGSMENVYSGKYLIAAFEPGAAGQLVALISRVAQPSELYRLAQGTETQLTHHNDELLARQPWQDAETIAFKSPDGTEVHGLLLRPRGATAGRRYPAVLWLHGGPTAQFAYEATIEAQLFAAKGYAVIMVNPRGSTGRGLAYAKAILGAWGSVDVPDVLAAVDHVVAMGVADPERLVVGGWSYGGMLTNYVIASDTRFRAAASGASIGNAWAGFGTDMYIREYLSELGRPWENPEAYNRVSYPFMHADRIVTPTIFLVGQSDYNVPLLASEQMYQALKVLDVPTRLVIYPGQSHHLDPPSYQADCYQRYLDWYHQHLGDRGRRG
jgi:dipeptidyl aminopeptidase/acylaminoacyl peptidase